MRILKILLFILIGSFNLTSRAQVDAFKTSSYLYNNYYLAPPLAERSQWFIPESFVQLSGFTGQVGPSYKIRNVSLVGNYSTKPNWGYTYRPIRAWSGWGGVFSKNWHPYYRETTYAPSYYWTFRTKMKNYDKRWDPPSKLSVFIQPQLVHYRTRNKFNVSFEKKNCYNIRAGFVFYKDKYFIGIQANRIFKHEQTAYLNDSIALPINYPQFYSLFASYRLKIKKLYLFRPSAVLYYQEGQFFFDANAEREILIEDLLPFELNLFAVAGYSSLNETISAALGVRRIVFDRLDAFYKFQKSIAPQTELGKQKALHELSVIVRLGPVELDRPDFVERD